MGTHIPAPQIIVVPFRYVQAFADIDTRHVFVSDQWLANADQNIRHELAHVISGDPDHGSTFRDQLESFGGIQPPSDDRFKQLRKRLGIPAKIAGNVGNVTGIQNILLDYHLLQAYRKFSMKVLGTEGHWEVINEANPTGKNQDMTASEQLIRLYPTPKGTFPVTVLYYPIVTHFRSPQAKLVTNKYFLAQVMQVLGRQRRKMANLPAPGGGTLGLDGDALVTEGQKLEEEVTKQAVELGEPMPIVML